MNRREALIATGGLLAVVTAPRVQAQTPITFDDIVIDPSVINGQQQALAQMINFCQNNPGAPVDSSLVDNAINWTNVWCSAVAGSGLGDRVDALLQPSDPNSLTGATVPQGAINDMQNTVVSMGVSMSVPEMLANPDFQAACSANAAMGGCVSMWNFVAGSLMPTLYPANTSHALAQARRAVALNYRLPNRKGGLTPHDKNTCQGVSTAKGILQVPLYGLAIASALGCVVCPIVAISHLLPLMVVTIVGIANHC